MRAVQQSVRKDSPSPTQLVTSKRTPRRVKDGTNQLRVAASPYNNTAEQRASDYNGRSRLSVPEAALYREFAGPREHRASKATLCNSFYEATRKGRKQRRVSNPPPPHPLPRVPTPSRKRREPNKHNKQEIGHLKKHLNHSTHIHQRTQTKTLRGRKLNVSEIEGGKDRSRRPSSRRKDRRKKSIERKHSRSRDTTNAMSTKRRRGSGRDSRRRRRGGRISTGNDIPKKEAKSVFRQRTRRSARRHKKTTRTRRNRSRTRYIMPQSTNRTE